MAGIVLLEGLWRTSRLVSELKRGNLLRVRTLWNLKFLVGMNIEYGKVCMNYLRRVLADCKDFVILENDLCWKSQSLETRTK